MYKIILILYIKCFSGFTFNREDTLIRLLRQTYPNSVKGRATYIHVGAYIALISSVGRLKTLLFVGALSAHPKWLVDMLLAGCT